MDKKEYLNKKIEQIVSIKDALERYKDDKKVKIEFKDIEVENDVAHLDFVTTLMSAINLIDELHRSYDHTFWKEVGKEMRLRK